MHKKDKKKFLNILFVPDSQDAVPKNFRVRYTTLNFLIVVGVILLVGIVVGIVTYSQVLQSALEKEEKERELYQLQEQLKKGNVLQSQLDTLRAYQERVRNSLQGYITYADQPDEGLIAAQNIIQAKSVKSSILTNVPLVAPVQGFVSQEYKLAGHPGIDIVAPEGTPVKAAADGVVIFSGWTYDDGYVLILYHSNGFVTHYRHNSRNLVSVNQYVTQNEIIAFLGNSGESSSGPHLHFEIWKDGKPYDPREYLSDLNNTGE